MTTYQAQLTLRGVRELRYQESLVPSARWSAWGGAM